MARKLETPYLSPPVVMIYKLSTNRAEFHAEEVKVLISGLFAYKTANMRNAFFYELWNSVYCLRVYSRLAGQTVLSCKPWS